MQRVVILFAPATAQLLRHEFMMPACCSAMVHESMAEQPRWPSRMHWAAAGTTMGCSKWVCVCGGGVLGGNRECRHAAGGHFLCASYCQLLLHDSCGHRGCFAMDPCGDHGFMG
jgi:hypothetical protein